METSNCGTGHGMPAELSPEVAKGIAKKEESKRKKQAKEFAKDSLPTKAQETTNVHESKHFPFQIVEVTRNDEKGEFKSFYVGTMNHLLSNDIFYTKKAAEDYIAKRPWELITNLICVTIQNAFEYEKSRTKC